MVTASRRIGVFAGQSTRTNLVHGNFEPRGNSDKGVHTMGSAEPFGLWAWVWAWGYDGTSKFTDNVSYGFPAGANVSKLNDVMP